MSLTSRISLKSIGKIAGVWVAIIFSCYLILESLFMCCTANLFPYAARVSFGFGIYPLLQTSKSGVIPRDYIAIFGDSFGFGAGDEFQQTQHLRSPAFNVTHFLHNKTGRDYISFAIPGSSNLCGWIEDPISSMNYINATMLYSIKPPSDILLYFYEGNDIEDTWRDLQDRYISGQYSMERINDEKYFSEFIQHEMLEKNQVNIAAGNISPIENFMLMKYAKNAREVREEGKKIMELIKKIKPTEPGNINSASLKGADQWLPDNLSTPPVFMENKNIDDTLAFINSISRYVRKYFSSSRISIIYIPSAASSYMMTSENISAYNPDGGNVFPTQKVKNLSNNLCLSIRKIAEDNNMNFYDTRLGIMKHGKEARIHGPLDWGHFNKAGYTALADEIEIFMGMLDQSPAGNALPPCAVL